MQKLYMNIKKRRTELHMTQDELAVKMGYSDKGMISKIENGLVDISYSKIIEFSEVLRIDPIELMGWKEMEVSESETENAIVKKINHLPDSQLGKLDEYIDFLGLQAKKEHKPSAHRSDE